jgi:RNA polymerase sigma-70 factor (ECF subfamily)
MKASPGSYQRMQPADASAWSEERRALAGDRPTWDSLVARHSRAVELSLLAHGERLSDAKELTQAAWAHVYECVAQGRFSRLELPGLVIHQAGLLAKEQHRSAARAVPAVSEERPPTPEDVVGSRRAIARVQAELARAPATAQRVFALLHGQPPMTPAEAAQELGLSVQRVRQVLCEVRARLRVALEEKTP